MQVALVLGDHTAGVPTAGVASRLRALVAALAEVVLLQVQLFKWWAKVYEEELERLV